MTPLLITPSILDQAHSKSKAIGTLNRSFMNGTRNIIGQLGESLFNEIYPSATQADSYDYDFILNGKRIEVKSRITTVTPKTYFEFALERKTQEADRYAFFVIHKNLVDAWYVGMIEKHTLLEDGYYTGKGTPMPQGGFYKVNGWTITIDKIERTRIG